MSGEELERAREERKDVVEDVWGVEPDNWQSYCLFNALSTQWRFVAGLGGCYYEGIDYAAAKAAFWAMRVKKRDRARVFEDLRIMERAALPILNGVETKT